MKKNKKNEVKNEKVYDDPIWVNSKRYNFNIKNMIERFPDGCPDRIIANALGITEEEVEQYYNKAIKKIQKHMGIENE